MTGAGGLMRNWIRFALIVLVVVVDDVLRELIMSFTASRDFVRRRVSWTLQDKIRSLRKK